MIIDDMCIFYSIREDVCESKVEIVTPYWASNSNGKVNIIEVLVLIMFLYMEYMKLLF